MSVSRWIFIALLALVVHGCAEPAPRVPTPADVPVTFNAHIVRLLQHHCQGCHREGEVAPFPLVTYGDAYRQRRKIVTMLQKRKMPPWKAVPGHGEFADDRRLSDAEIGLVARWVEADAPEGDPRDLPPPRKFRAGWTFGPPGAVLTMEEPFTVPARSRDVYRCFTIPINLAGADRTFIRATEVVPGNRKIVHHVVTYLDLTGISVELDRREPGPGYTCFGGPLFNAAGGLGGWVPGSVPLEVPSGVAWGFQPGARLVIQVHYHNPGPTAETDQTRIGLYVASGPFDRALRRVWPMAWGFTIPAGEARYSVTSYASVARDDHFEAIAVLPHMHLIGREIRVTAHLPNGTKRPLIYIDDWDFDWQLRYTFKRPVPLPGSTQIEVECVYDNSSANPRNPSSPPRDVRSGFATTDEMCNASVLGTVSLPRRGHLPERWDFFRRPSG